MQLHEYWRTIYRSNRYLARVELASVVRRLRELIENLTTLTDGNKIGVRPVKGADESLWAAFTHAHEELVLRDESFPVDFMKGASVPKPTAVGQRAIAAARSYPKDLAGMMVKYGERRYVHDMLERGTFQIRPASSYNDPSLNPAQADDELSITLYAQPHEVTLRTIDGRPIEPVAPVEVSFTTQSDYYVWCCSRCYDFRLFDDFSYDSCLLISDIERLTRLLVAALQDQNPGWQAVASDVVYVDPFRPPHGGRPFVHFVKHFRYYYQQEFRIVWLPPEPARATVIKPALVNIGPLTEFCDVIDL
jgi:hypothetical protein